MIYKVLGALIIGAAVALAVLSFQEDIMQATGTTPGAQKCAQLTPAQQLNKLINDDLTQLGRQGQLPPAWKKIATVEYRMNSTLANALLGKVRPGIQRVKDGTAYLELEVLDLPDETNPGIIVQASLFDIKSRNKIFEIGRTYTMLDLNDPVASAKIKKEEAEFDRKQAAARKAAQTPPPAARPTTPAVQPPQDANLPQPTPQPRK